MFYFLKYQIIIFNDTSEIIFIEGYLLKYNYKRIKTRRMSLLSQMVNDLVLHLGNMNIVRYIKMHQ